MTDNQHIIRKAAVNFQFSDTDDMAVQQEATDWCRNILNPSIDQAFKEFEHHEELIILDSLRLDISLDKNSGWQEGLTEKIVSGLKDKLLSTINTTGKRGTIIPSLKRTGEVLAYYFRTGMLPWYTNITSLQELKDKFSNWVHNSPVDLIKGLTMKVKEGNAAKRVVELLSEKDLKIFLAVAMEVKTEFITELYQDIKSVAGSVTGIASGQKKWTGSIIRSLIAGERPEQAMEKWLAELAIDYPENIQAIIPETIRGEMVKNILIQVQIKDLKESAKDIKDKSGITRQNINLEKNQKYIQADPIPGNMITRRVPEGPDQTIIRGSDSELPANEAVLQQSLEGRENLYAELTKELADGVFINNAGAVIITPFLYPLFSRLGLHADGSITDMDKALYTLHYCITGNTKPAEFELILPKILCGAEPGRVTDAEVYLGEEILKEADEMLASIVEHWSALKSTSIEGLRESFLMREGKLSLIKDSWLLKVEQRAYDMLLQQLPWNISMIKLPWMQNLLKTEWA